MGKEIRLLLINSLFYFLLYIYFFFMSEKYLKYFFIYIFFLFNKKNKSSQFWYISSKNICFPLPICLTGNPFFYTIFGSCEVIKRGFKVLFVLLLGPVEWRVEVVSGMVVHPFGGTVMQISSQTHCTKRMMKRLSNGLPFRNFPPFRVWGKLCSLHPKGEWMRLMCTNLGCKKGELYLKDWSELLKRTMRSFCSS